MGVGDPRGRVLVFYAEKAIFLQQKMVWDLFVAISSDQAVFNLGQVGAVTASVGKSKADPT